MKKFRVSILVLFAAISIGAKAQTEYSAIAGASPHLVRTGRYGNQKSGVEQLKKVATTSHAGTTTTQLQSDGSFKKGTQKAKNGARELGEGMSEAASSGWTNVKNGASKGWKRLSKGASDSWKNAGTEMKKVGKGAGEFFHKLGKGISDSFKKDSTNSNK